MLKLGSLQPSLSFVAEDLSLFPVLNAVLPSDCFRNICALLTELWTGYFQNMEVKGSGAPAELMACSPVLFLTPLPSISTVHLQSQAVWDTWLPKASSLGFQVSRETLSFHLTLEGTKESQVCKSLWAASFHLCYNLVFFSILPKQWLLYSTP